LTRDSRRTWTHGSVAGVYGGSSRRTGRTVGDRERRWAHRQLIITCTKQRHCCRWEDHHELKPGGWIQISAYQPPSARGTEYKVVAPSHDDPSRSNRPKITADNIERHSRVLLNFFAGSLETRHSSLREKKLENDSD
jgi:hypothetical protein